MSKSLGNYIGIDEKPEIIYEKTMTLPDEMIIKYFNLVTDIHPDEVTKFEEELNHNKINPRDIKMKLAKEIVRLYHGEEEAEKAENRFKMIFQKGIIPDDIEIITVENNYDISEELVLNNIVKSKNEFRRLLTQGGIKVNGVKVNRVDNIEFETEINMKIGKKKFICFKKENNG